jgi:hypothetical protein
VNQLSRLQEHIQVFSNSNQATSPWLMLIAQLVLFATMQVLIALVLLLQGIPNPWYESARWWVFSVIITNVLTILWLIRLFRLEGKRYIDVLRFERNTFWKDLGLAIVAFILAAPIGFLPGQVIAKTLFGASDVPVAIMYRSLPLWAILVGFLFPLTIALSELPTYFGYAMPRLEQQLGNGWSACVLASIALSLQHITIPLILDWRFILWRGLMFLPFAFFLGLLLKFRPRLLPYLMVAHFLIDLLALSTYFAS